MAGVCMGSIVHRETERELVATARGGRLVHLLWLRGRISVTDAAQALECTVGNVYKVIDKLSLAGVPLSLECGVIVIYLDGDSY
jgi:predicted DNA-binding transcriptional regulator YafY